MTEELERLEKLENDLDELKELFHKDNYTNHQDFRKDIKFKGKTKGVALTELFSSSNSNTGNSTWEDWDISSLVPERTSCVEVSLLNTGVSAIAMGTRKNGSALERKIGIGAGNFDGGTMLCEVGSDRIIETFSSDYANSGFRIIGYF